MAADPRDELRSAFERAGWNVRRWEPLSGRSTAANPLRVDLQRGRQHRMLLVYVWNASAEGAGRTRHDAGDPRYRVQTTRHGDGDLLFEAGRTSVGIGWRPDWDVFFAFDLWAKRFAGKSSSVYVEPALLDLARTDGVAEEEREDCLEIAFLPDRIDALFSWNDRLAERRTLLVQPTTLDTSADGESAVATALDRRSTWLREGDQVIFSDDGRLSDRTLWQVSEARGEHGEGRNSVLVHLTLRRHGKVLDDSWLPS